MFFRATPVPVFSQAVKQSPVTRHCRCRLIEHNNIYTPKHVAVLSERFSDDAFQTIASRTQSAVPFADGKTQPWRLSVVRSKKNGEHFVAAALRLFKNATKVVLVGEPVTASKAIVWRVAYCSFVFRDRLAPYQGVSYASNIARRRFDTSRPAFVAIRARNPCVRARFNLLG